MAQTLPDITSHPDHPAPHYSLRAVTLHHEALSLELLLQTMAKYLTVAKGQLRHPRQQAVDYILKKASELN
ncbi:MAG: hypothetical protein JST36_03020 [Bacteroidetes bacterium]|nr:hypothetical protein [Bacteroidota bacterium]